MSADKELQEKVTEELFWDPTINSTHIGVTAKDGIVTLSGYVTNYFEKKKCEEIVKRVRNVIAVVDELDLKLPGSIKRNDLDIAESAISALNHNVLIPKNGVQITVDDGQITLEGEVDWQYQYRAAENALRTMQGIKGITNKIRVKPAAMVNDVKSKIKSALVRNAQIDANNIQVEIEGGIAKLHGQVHSWAEKNQAEMVTWAAPGISKVENEIRIIP